MNATEFYTVWTVVALTQFEVKIQLDCRGEDYQYYYLAALVVVTKILPSHHRSKQDIARVHLVKLQTEVVSPILDYPSSNIFILKYLENKMEPLFHLPRYSLIRGKRIASNVLTAVFNKFHTMIENMVIGRTSNIFKDFTVLNPYEGEVSYAGPTLSSAVRRKPTNGKPWVS